MGLLTPARSFNLPKFEERILDTLYICLVTKGVQKETIRRSYEAMRSLEAHNVKLRIVTDCHIDVPHILVPESFKLNFGRYKARALEYFRVQTHLGENDWVLHLDEESVLDAHGLQACLDFIRRSRSLLGQGQILYNNHNFWKHPILTAADCIRVADDLGKFHLQYALLHKPIFGVHGSFILINGKLENEITWDLPGSLVEDYAFAIECMKRGYSCDEIHGMVREQSPQSIVDFLRQRRRWLVGIRGLSQLCPWARLWSVLWSLSPLVKLAVVIDVFFGVPKPWFIAIPGMTITLTYLYPTFRT